MKSHLLLWGVALVVALLAATIYLSRNSNAYVPPHEKDPDGLVADTLALLKEDVYILQHATRAAIRRVAVDVEQGTVSSAQGAYLLGIQYMREQNFQGAEAHFKRAIALDPAWSWPYADLGSLLGRHSFKRTEEAMEVLRKCIALDPEWGRPHSIMAIILRAQGRFEEARVEAEIALKYMPDQLASLNNYANILMDLGRDDEAETYLRRAIANYPEQAKPYYNLACLFSIEGRIQEALENLKKAFQRSDSLRLRHEALNDPDFASIRDNPGFLALMDRKGPPS